ncbi:MAG: VOC family protein [Candidatus Electrothrix sp. AR4]|nr:VOC family protein [Candidatus Electrothrix sp. AR4]
MKFKGINHLAMVTSDMNATIRFWRDLMGMRLLNGFGEAGFRHYFFEIDEKNSLAFFEWEGARPAEPKLHGRPFSGPLVFDHIAFGLDSHEEVWELKDKLEAAGFPCSDMIDHGFIHSVYAFDPNGIPIEFCYEVVGQEIRKNPVLHDSDPPAAAMEGAEPQSDKWPEVTTPTPTAEQVVKSGDGSGFFKK